MSTLREIQHRMATAVMQPLTAKDAVPRRLRTEAEEIIKPNDRLSSLERLEIYSRSYWFRVLDSLVEDFPGVRAIVGVREFHALSRDYLVAHPSTSFTLRNLGSRFVSWLEVHAERLNVDHDLVLDMARLEWAHIEAFDAAQHAVIPADAWARGGESAVLRLQPYLRLVRAQFAVDDLLLEVRGLQNDNHKIAQWRRQRLGQISRQEEFIVVHRVDHSVCYRRVEREAFRVLEALHDGGTLGEALERAFTDSSQPQDRWPVLVQEWFGLWMRLGWFAA